MTTDALARRDEVAGKLATLDRQLVRDGLTREQIVAVNGRVAALDGITFESAELDALAAAALAAVGEAAPASANGDGPEIVDVQYLARRLLLSRSSVYDLLRRVEVPGRLDLDSQRIKFARRALDAWLDGNAQAPARRKRGGR